MEQNNINNEKMKGLIENKQVKYEKQMLQSFYSGGCLQVMNSLNNMISLQMHVLYL